MTQLKVKWIYRWFGEGNLTAESCKLVDIDVWALVVNSGFRRNVKLDELIIFFSYFCGPHIVRITTKINLFFVLWINFIEF